MGMEVAGYGAAGDGSAVAYVLYGGAALVNSVNSYVVMYVLTYQPVVFHFFLYFF